MRIRDHRAEDNPEINLVPLIDVILCLIIFFVITTTFDARSVLQAGAAAAPTASRPMRKTKPLSVLINAEGRYFVDDREVAAHRRRIAQAHDRRSRRHDRERTVLLRADARTPHQAVVTASTRWASSVSAASPSPPRRNSAAGGRHGQVNAGASPPRRGRSTAACSASRGRTACCWCWRWSAW